jgi:hypothetical protein
LKISTIRIISLIQLVFIPFVIKYILIMLLLTSSTFLLKLISESF